MEEDYEDGWFRAMLKTGLCHLGSIRFNGFGPEAQVTLTEASGRMLTFEQTIYEIHSGIVIDEETRAARWPDWSVAAASVAAFAGDVEQALLSAGTEADTLRLTGNGTEAAPSGSHGSQLRLIQG
ncbi:hypothetical protein IWX75_000324 [Arthrobacter sp. CAN_A6]|uniref:hypothetical protein n=1 Tax=Arthrobacter sp. CAN_A6 TaxID=2787721 RepID=UPI0018CA5F09